MYRRLWCLVLIISLTGCASFAPPRADKCLIYGLTCTEEARVERVTLQNLLDLPKPNQKAVVAVYAFDDLTGQRSLQIRWLYLVQQLLKVLTII